MRSAAPAFPAAFLALALLAGAAWPEVALAAGPAEATPAAAPRLLVSLPRDGASLEPQVRRAFSWAELTLLSPDNVAQRFPPSEESRTLAAESQRAEELLRKAESAFVALQLDQAARDLSECEQTIERLPPSPRREALLVRARLLQCRVGQARGDERAWAESIAQAAEAATDVELDEADYPPQVRQAFLAARAEVRARPARPAEIASEPPGAEVEINGKLAGRTPARVSLPAGRCFVSITRAGFRPHLAACPSEPRLEVALQPATRDGLRDQLRERLASDPAWFLQPLLLETLASEAEVKWIVALDRDRGGGLKALVFSAAEHAIKPVEPSRFVETVDKLAEAVKALVARIQRLEAQVVETPTGVPGLEARAADPSLGSAAVFVRRAGDADFLRLAMSPQSAGRFTGALPLSLATDGGWDVDYFVEAYDAGGALACRAGSAAAPLRFLRGPVGVAAARTGPAWYTRWYVWTAVGAVAAGAAATIYFGTRPRPVLVTFGAGP